MGALDTHQLDPLPPSLQHSEVLRRHVLGSAVALSDDRWVTGTLVSGLWSYDFFFSCVLNSFGASFVIIQMTSFKHVLQL